MTLNINLIGGPGVGKSVLMCALFVDLKRRGVHAELVPEYAKDLHYEGRLHRTKQERILREQWRRQARLQGKTEVAITDSPVPQNLVYMDPQSREKALRRVRRLTGHWQCINVLLYRDLDEGYEKQGRYQSKDEAKAFHHNHVVPLMREFFGDSLIELHVNQAQDVLVREVLSRIRPLREAA